MAVPTGVRAVSDTGSGICICNGNWHLIKSEMAALVGKRYRDRQGNEFAFFGIVDGIDDYYYGMYSDNAGLRLLSCVGHLGAGGHEFEVIEPIPETS